MANRYSMEESLRILGEKQRKDDERRKREDEARAITAEKQRIANENSIKAQKSIDFRNETLGATVPQMFHKYNELEANRLREEAEKTGELYNTRVVPNSEVIGYMKPWESGKDQKPYESSYLKSDITPKRGTHLESYRIYNDPQEKLDAGETLTPAEALEYAQKKRDSLSASDRKTFDQMVESYKNNTLSPGMQPRIPGKEDPAPGYGNRPWETALDTKDRDRFNSGAKKLGRDFDYFSKVIAEDEINRERQNALYGRLHTGNSALDTVNATGENIQSVLGSPFRGFAAIGANFEKRPNGFPVSAGSIGYRPQKNTENVQEATLNRIGNNGFARGAYNVGYSTAESLYNMALAGAAGAAVGATGGAATRAASLIPFGSSAYGSTLHEAERRGLSPSKAQATAVVAGLAEMGTEIFSLDHFWDTAKNSHATARKLVVDWAAQAGIEGSEELASDAINFVADNLINADKSEYNQRVRQLMNNGMHPDAARKQATNEQLHSMAESFLMGAASGGLMGGVAAGSSYINTRAQAKSMLQNDSFGELKDALDTEAANYKSKSAYKGIMQAQKLAERFFNKAEKGETVSDREKAHLFAVMTNAMEVEENAREKIGISSVYEEISQKQEVEHNAEKFDNERVREAYLSNFDENMGAARYDILMTSALAASRNGISIEKYMSMKGNAFAATVGKEAVEKAYKVGAGIALEDARAETVRSLKQATGATKGNGIFIDSRADKSTEIPSSALKSIAEIIGLDIEIKDGLKVNGFFDPKNSKITIDAKGPIARTLFHELGEFTSVYNAPEFQEAVKSIISYGMEKQGGDQFGRLRNAYANAYSFEKGKSEADIDKEMACDTLFAVLGNEQGMTELFDSIESNIGQEKAKSLKQKIIDFIGKIIDTLHSFMASDDVRKMNGFQKTFADSSVKELEEIRNQLTRSIGKAVGNYQNDVDLAAEYGVSATGQDDSARYAVKLNGSKIIVENKIDLSKGTTLKERISHVLNNKNMENTHVYIGDMPAEISETLGISNLPMLMTGHHVYSTIVSEATAIKDGRYKSKTNYHDLGDATFIKSISDLSDPAMLIKSDIDSNNARFVVVTNTIDKSGSLVIVAVQPNGKGRIDNVEIDADILLSDYGKKNITNYINTAFSEDRILFINKNISRKNSPGFQLPYKILTTDYSNSLRQFRDVVKTLYGENENNRNSVSVDTENDNMNPTDDVDIRYSVQVSGDGFKYVNVDVDQEQFRGLNIRNLRNKVKEIILDKFSGKEIGKKEDAPVVATKTTAKEYAFSDKRSYTDSGRKAKLRASTELDNLLSVSKFIKHESYDEVKEEHPEAYGGIDKYMTIFKFGDYWFSGRINIINKKRVRVFYDITKIRSIEESEIPSEFGRLTPSNAPEEIVSQYRIKNNDDLRRSLDTSWDAFMEMLADSSDDTGEASRILEDGAEALKGTPVDTKAIKKIAVELRAKYGSKYDLKVFSGDLEKIFAYAQKYEKIDYNDLLGVISGVAEPFIEEATMKYGEDEYRNFLSAFGKSGISLTSKQKEEVISAFGSYQAYRRAMKGINISDQAGIDLDSVWGEIADQTGMLDREASEGDQPLMLYDALDSVRPRSENIYGENTEEFARDMAMEIVERYFEEKGLKESSDKMKRQKEAYRQKVRDRYNDRLKKEKEKIFDHYKDRLSDTISRKNEQQKEALAKLRAKNRSRAMDLKERRLIKEQKEAIKQDSAKLYNWLDRPTDANHVPKKLQNAVIAYLDAVDYGDAESHITKDRHGKFKVRIWNGHKMTSTAFDTKEAAKQFYDSELTKGRGSRDARSWRDRMAEIERMYQSAVSENIDSELGDFLQKLDPALHSGINEILDSGKGIVSLDQLGSKDLKILSLVGKNIIHAVIMENKMISAPSQDVLDVAQSINAHARSVHGRKNHGGRANWALDFLTLDNATPETYLHGLGKGGDKLFKILLDSYAKKAADLKQAQEYMADVLKGEDINTLTGGNVKLHEYKGMYLTTAQIMSLYEYTKRPDARSHFAGGFAVEEMKIKGKQIEQKPKHFTYEEVVEITNLLTDKQKEMADKIQRFLADTAGAWGNEASNAMFGYDKFTDPHYFPISVLKTTVNTKSYNAGNPLQNNIKNSGFTKQIIPDSKNPVVLKDIFDIYTQHVADMATYHSYAAPLTDVLRVLNYKTVEDRSDGFAEYDTVKDAIKDIYGKKGQLYMENLIRSINEKEQTNFIASKTDVAVGRYKAAAVGGNFRVIIQQPTAYVRAAMMIDPQYLIAGLAPNKMAKEMQDRTSSISWAKKQGNIDGHISKSTKTMLTGSATALEKMTEATMSPAGKADDITWEALYRATYLQEKARFEKAGKETFGDKFEKAVNDSFNLMIARTQVIDATILRTQFMRSNDNTHKFQSAFMAEPAKTYNIMLRGWIEGMQKDGYKGAVQAIIKPAVVCLFTAVATALAESLADAVRKDDDSTKWVEVYQKSFIDNLSGNINILNTLPFIKSISRILTESGFMNEGKMDMQVFVEARKLLLEMDKLKNGTSQKTAYGIIEPIARFLSMCTGIPFYNILRDSKSLYNGMNDMWHGEDIYRTIKEREDNQKRKAFSLIDSGGDYQKVLKELIDDGAKPDGLKTSITKQYKERYLELKKSDPAEASKMQNRIAMAQAYLCQFDGAYKDKSYSEKVEHYKKKIDDWGKE